MADAKVPARRVVSAYDAEAFRPFDRYGAPIRGMRWLPLSFAPERGGGTYLLRIDPGVRSLPHEHTGGEEFLMLEGTLVDHDGTVFRAGDFVAFAPGSRHFSVSPEGCLIAVFMRGLNRPLEGDEAQALGPGPEV